ncbi:MAG: fibronectin type III domain-containing protein [Actinomycetota bacterium]|nr:fibronectin type III domain-containing protein [Actinomycetota bacterium]
MKLGLATLAAFVALVAAAPAHASTPMPWCGTSASGTDRLPDTVQAFSIHVAYVRAAGAPDRFADWAPRIVGDAAAIDAFLRREDPTRSFRFDLFPAPGCSTPFGALDITSVELPQGIGGISRAFQTLRLLLASEIGFREPEKSYLVYFDGSTGQVGNDRVCGQGAPGGSFGLPGLAVVYLDSCTAGTSDSLRPIVAVHELLHVFGAVSDRAPNHCNDGHVCDVGNDLLTASLNADELDENVLDAGRNDYYGHSGTWRDVQDSFFLEPLVSPDRAAPTTPTSLRAGDDSSGATRFTWQPSTDDVGPISYRVYQEGVFLREIVTTSFLLSPNAGATTLYSVRAVDAVGRLSAPASVRFREGVGIVDGQGRLIRDTVRPPAIRGIAIRKATRSVAVSWSSVRDAGGIRGYRVRIGTRTLTLTKPTVTISRARLRAPVSITAVDRGGNVGPATLIPLSRLR